MSRKRQHISESVGLSIAEPDATKASTGDASSLSVLSFIEQEFIPRHVQLKTAAGRTHYQAILKHIVKPESVARAFAPHIGGSRTKLKTLSAWPYLDDVRVCDLSSDHVRQLVSVALERGYSTQTVKHIRNVLGTILSHARKMGQYRGENPVSEVELPPMIRKRPPTLTIGQAKAVLRAMEYPEREIALFVMAIGMTIWEICALRWKNVNLTIHPIRIDEYSIPPKSILVTKKGSGNPARSISVPDSLIETLEELRTRNRAPDPNDFVIASGGEPAKSATIRTMRLKPLARKLDMPWLSWQVLKRTHEGLLSELRIVLAEELILGARLEVPAGGI